MLPQSFRALVGPSRSQRLFARTFVSSTTMSIPKTQKAIFQPDVMSTEVIMTTDPVPTPKPSSSEHLIRVHTTAITNGELLWSRYFPPSKSEAAEKVLVPCNDVAGTVVTAPEDSPFKPGTEVYARANYNRTGCAREYTILLTEEMSKRPQNLSWAESAVVPMSAETAWQALFEHVGWEAKAGEGAKGKRIFITAASGGVGVWMVQLAKWAGAHVTATCGANNVAWVKSLGADEVIDYKKTDIKQWASGEGKKVDVAIDCIGQKSLEDAWWTVKAGGTLISIYQPTEQKKPNGVEDNIRNFFFIMKTVGEQLRKLTDLIESGIGKPALDSVFPVDQFQDAFKKVESGKTRGKVVLEFVSN
jgi:NADPH:quinone reductase-like Zn-dependent oxidoreductase